MLDLKWHDWINSTAFFPDNEKILTSTNKTTEIWDARNGILLLSLKGYATGISPDGRKIITASWDKTVNIWNTQNGVLLINLKAHKDIITSAVFSPDGTKILTASKDETAKIWDATSGVLLADLIGQSPVVSANFSPDGKKVITASQDATAKIWDASTGLLLVDLKGYNEWFNSAVFSPDGKKILSVEHSRAKVWDAASGLLLIDIGGHNEFINSAVFSPDGKKVITASTDHTAKIWDATNGALLADLKGHTTHVASISFPFDDKKILTSADVPRLWDATTGKLLANLNELPTSVNSTIFSSDRKKIISIANDNVAKVWDASNGKLLVTLKGYVKNIEYAVFSPDGNKIAIANNYDHVVKIWNASNGLLLAALKGYKPSIESLVFSPDNKKLLIASADDTIKLWNATNYTLLLNINEWQSSAVFSPNGKNILTVGETAKIWDATNGALLAELGQENYFLKSAFFSPDGSRIVTTAAFNSKDEAVKVWDASSGKLLADIKGHTTEVASVTFSPNSKKFVTTASWDNTAKVWDATNGKLLAVIKGHTGGVSSVFFSPDNKKLVTTAWDNTCKVWDVETGKLIYTFFSIDSTDYFNQIPSGYYQATSNAAKLLHYVTKDLKVITFEQLDIKYNRPDKVLEAIGSTDTVLIRSYRKAYEKRIKKLGIDTTAFRSGYSVPEADFANRNIIDYEQTGKTLKLFIKSVDSTYKLDRFNIWVNETPLYGQRGINLRKRNKNSFDSTITIALSAGENKIETSITNVNGTESYRMPLPVNYTPAVKQPVQTYFIGIGIDRFTDNKYNLKYSTKDIRDLSKKLKEKYSDIIIDTLFNENVTISNVKALKQKLLQTSVNDKVIISYSGHGMLSKDFDYYLSTYAVNFDMPEENGLPYDELESLLDSIPARKKLMLIDACHSGEVDKDDLIAMNATDKKLIKGLKPVTYKKDGQLGLKNSFELMQNLFVNVGKSTGATIISAAAGTQFALEGIDNLPNGVFTYCILEAMKKYPSMKISELKKIVGERVVELTKGLQKPTSRNETIAVDWEIW